MGNGSVTRALHETGHSKAGGLTKLEWDGKSGSHGQGDPTSVQGWGKHLQSGELEEGVLENTASNHAVWLEGAGPLNDT